MPDTKLADLPAVPAPTFDYYVSSSAGLGGDGTIDRPWTLTSAASSSAPIATGSTVYLAGGTYTGAFTIAKDATLGAPIMFRSTPGELAVIDGSVEVAGDYLHLRDIRITDSNTDRTTVRTSGLMLTGMGTKAINCLSDNTGVATASYQSGAGAEFYGCLTLNQGWQGVDRGHGHSIYIQNGTGVEKLIRACIFGPGFGWGIHCYTENGVIDDITYTDNIAALAGALDSGGAHPIFLIGGGEDADDQTIEGFYGLGVVDIGYDTGSHTKSNLTVDGGRIDGTYTGQSVWSPLNVIQAIDVNPGTQQVVVIGNSYEDGRAHVACFNPDEDATMDADFTGILDNGDTYYVFNAFNPLAGPIATGVYSGPVSLPTTGLTCADPVGSPPAATYPANFAAFVIRKVATWVAPPL